MTSQDHASQAWRNVHGLVAAMTLKLPFSTKFATRPLYSNDSVVIRYGLKGIA